jgi:hypothetical protein
MINARAETVAPKSAFRVAYKIRRCLIPDGDCYKWKRDVEPKQLHFIHKHDGSPLALAGLWETWKGPDKTIQSCTVVTTEANSMMTEQHHHNAGDARSAGFRLMDDRNDRRARTTAWALSVGVAGELSYQPASE